MKKGLAKIFQIHPLRFGYTSTVHVLTMKSNHGKQTSRGLYKAHFKIYAQGDVAPIARTSPENGRNDTKTAQKLHFI